MEALFTFGFSISVETVSRDRGDRKQRKLRFIVRTLPLHQNLVSHSIGEHTSVNSMAGAFGAGTVGNGLLKLGEAVVLGSQIDFLCALLPTCDRRVL